MRLAGLSFSSRTVFAFNDQLTGSLVRAAAWISNRRTRIEHDNALIVSGTLESSLSKLTLNVIPLEGHNNEPDRGCDLFEW